MASQLLDCLAGSSIRRAGGSAYVEVGGSMCQASKAMAIDLEALIVDIQKELENLQDSEGKVESFLEASFHLQVSLYKPL